MTPSCSHAKPLTHIFCGGILAGITGNVYSSIPRACNKANIMPAVWDNALPWLEQWYKMDLSYLEVGSPFSTWTQRRGSWEGG